MIKSLKSTIDQQKEKRFLYNLKFNLFNYFRNKFEEEILKVIDDTCFKLTKFIQEDTSNDYE